MVFWRNSGACAAESQKLVTPSARASRLASLAAISAERTWTVR